MSSTAIYVRVSTDKQNPERQRNEIKNYLGDEQFEQATEYVDIAQSGSTDQREQFQRLWTDIEHGVVDRVVSWEISRLSRRLSTAAEFMELCAEQNVALETLNDMFPNLQGDSGVWDELLAKFSAWMMEFEREMTRERIHSGVHNAIDQGKWVGRPPFGFDMHEGYLRVDPDPFIRMQLALEEAIRNNGHGIANTAERHDVPSSTLRNIYNDDDKRGLYLRADGYDERIDAALEQSDQIALDECGPEP